MLKGGNESIDLKAKAQELIPQITERLAEIKLKFGDDCIEILDEDVVNIEFPVLKYPVKISSYNFDKEVGVSGVLKGIKGQYLIFDTGVINIRKFTSYEISAEY